MQWSIYPLCSSIGMRSFKALLISIINDFIRFKSLIYLFFNINHYVKYKSFLQKLSDLPKIVFLPIVGVITNKQAKQENVGGEVLCFVY